MHTINDFVSRSAFKLLNQSDFLTNSQQIDAKLKQPKSYHFKNDRTSYSRFTKSTLSHLDTHLSSQINYVSSQTRAKTKTIGICFQKTGFFSGNERTSSSENTQWTTPHPELSTHIQNNRTQSKQKAQRSKCNSFAHLDRKRNPEKP